MAPCILPLRFPQASRWLCLTRPLQAAVGTRRRHSRASCCPSLGHIMSAHAPLLNAITTLLRHSTSNRALKYCECAKSYFSNVFKGIMFCLPIAKVFKVLPSVLVDNNILRFTVHRFRICPIKIPKHNYVRIINGLGQKNLVKICALGFHIYIKAVYNIILCIVFVYRKHCSTPKHVHRKSSL